MAVFKIPTLAVFSTAILACCLQDAAAQAPQCASHEAMHTMLAEEYEEHTVSRGITDAGTLSETLVSAEGTWSILVTIPGGQTRLVSSGEGWRPVKQVATGPEA